MVVDPTLALDEKQAEKILKEAIKRGLLHSDDVDFTGKPDGRYSARLKALIETGRLPLTWVLAFLKDQRIETGSQYILETQEGIDEETKEIIPYTRLVSLFEKLERYEYLGFLGSGGMGEVYKARDKFLDRIVAIKFLSYTNEDDRRRFIREARAQARVEHEYICRVYETGEVDGHLYIVMQYINGKPLSVAIEEMNLEERISLMIKIAYGLHAAHQVGLVHRDIKLSNIMVEYREDEGWHPYIVDFGLARILGVDNITISGAAVGTPAFMAPEQARGESSMIDRRTDIYSLGITFYYILTGQFPFDGSNAFEVILNTLSKDPQPLRELRPDIPVDLETIVMKCLEKDPNRRYASAKDFAEDLSRYLKGEPIVARPAGRIYLLKKSIKRNRTAFLLLSILLISFVAFMAFVIKSRVSANRRTQLAVRIGREIQDTQERMRYIYMQPPHDIRQDIKSVQTRLNGLLEELDKLGPEAKGTGQLAAGRVALLLHDYDLALEYLQNAWNAGFHDPVTAASLGMTYAALYMEHQKRAAYFESASLRDQYLQLLEENYRKPALKYLMQANLPSQSSPESLYLQALFAFHKGELDTSSHLIDRALKLRTWDYSFAIGLRILKGDIFFQKAKEALKRGQYSEALVELQKAEKAYQYAISWGPSDPLPYMAECLRRELLVTLVRKQGNDPWTIIPSLKEACTEGIKINPDDPRWYTTLAFAYNQILNYEIELRGRFPEKIFNETIRLTDVALKKSPDYVDALLAHSEALLYRGQYLAEQYRNPIPFFDQSIQQSLKVIEIAPDNVFAYLYAGKAFLQKAYFQSLTGDDPGPSFDRATQYLQHVLSIIPDEPDTLISMGRLYSTWAQYRMFSGESFKPYADKAITHLKRLLKKNPNNLQALYILGLTYATMANFDYDMNGHPLDNIQQTKKYYSKVIEINPTDPNAHQRMTNILLLEILYNIHSRQNPKTSITQAEKHCMIAIDLKPDFFSYINCAWVKLLDGLASYYAQRDPIPALRQAQILSSKALSSGDDNPDIYIAIAEINRAFALSYHRSGQDPLPYIKQAEYAAQKALEIDPTYLDLYRLQGLVAHEMFTYLYPKIQNDSKDRLKEMIHRALNNVRALKKRPLISPETYALEGVLMYHLEQLKPQPSIENLKQSARLVTSAIEKNHLLGLYYEPILNEINETIMKLQNDNAKSI